MNKRPLAMASLFDLPDNAPYEASPDEDAYEEGYAAYLNGVAEDANPYEADTGQIAGSLEQADAWARGHAQASIDSAD